MDKDLKLDDCQLMFGDCLEKMKELPDESVHCVITSPPYNVGLNYNYYDDNKEHQLYLDFMKKVFIQSYRVLSKDGRMIVNIGDGKNGSIPTHSDFIQICKKIGFQVLTTIIWNKNTTSNRTAWGSFMRASSPSFPRCFEYILVFRKSHKLLRKGVSTISKEEFIQFSNGYWNMNTEKLKKVGHPAAFPLQLPERCIKLFTYEGDVVLDPFMGSGTTGVACINTNRKFIGIELDKNYYDISCKRIKEAINEKKQQIFK